MKNISTKLNKTIWIDLLCFSSAVKAVSLSFRQPIDKVYYINIHKFFKPFIGVLSRIIGKPLDQVLDVIEPEVRLNGLSLYETIQNRLTKILEAWVKEKDVTKRINSFARKYGFNPAKFVEHQKESAYYRLFRPIELQVLSKALSGEAVPHFILIRSPFQGLIKNVLGKDAVTFYSALLLRTASVEKRPVYYYDKYVNNKYYGSHFGRVLDLLRFWVSACLNGLISPIFFRKLRAQKSPQGDPANIGVELILSRVCSDERNDLYWFNGSNLDSCSVCALEFVDYDQASSKLISDLGLKRYKIAGKLIKNPFKLLRQLFNGRLSVTAHDLVFAGRNYFAKTAAVVIGLIPVLLKENSESWLRLNQISYVLKTTYWTSVYKQLGLKVLWSMHDVHEDKLIKAQALELLGGVLSGTHWSNFPMYRIDNQKCYDVLFTWGPHFINNNFNKYPFLGIFQVGYPSDHYFQIRKPAAQALRDRFADKFILSYQDNIMANDLPYSKKMQLDLHRTLISILKENDNVVLFLKPKRKFTFDAILNDLPELQDFIDHGKVEVFLGDTPMTKAVPAEIGMASDLVIGLGISTTAAECCFAGTVSFHADLTGFTNNAFGNAGLNKVVFRDIDSLKTAIEAQIAGKGMSVDECRKYHRMLDPFQDGQAYKRTGFVIKKLQEAFQAGLSREEAVKSAQKAYENSIAEKEAVLI